MSELKEGVRTFVDAMRLLAECTRLLFRGALRKDDFILAMNSIGVESLPIITLSTAFSGMVVTDEMAWHMNEALQNTSLVPGLTSQFIMRELGIAIPALLLVSKVGASMTAEVGSMRVTDQIDALKLLKINPVAYLVLPRWVAGTLSTLCLTLIAILVTLGFSMLVACLKYRFSTLEYLNLFRHFVKQQDIFFALAKSAVFGCVIPLLACAYGFRTRTGAQGVGTATTNAVVASTLAVIALDFILTYFFTMMYNG